MSFPKRSLGARQTKPHALDVVNLDVGMTLPRGAQLDLDVDTRGQVELHERIDRSRMIEDVEKTLVRTDLELLAALLSTWGPRRTCTC